MDKSNIEGAENKGAAPVSNAQVEVHEETVNCTYSGQAACHFTHNGEDFSLHPGETYALPNTDFVQSLIGQNKLTKN